MLNLVQILGVMTTVSVSFVVWNDVGNGDPRGIKCSGSGTLTNGANFAKMGPYLHLKIPSNLVFQEGSSSSLVSNKCIGWVLIAPVGGVAFYQIVRFCTWKINSGSNPSDVIMEVDGYYPGFGPTTV